MLQTKYSKLKRKVRSEVMFMFLSWVFYVYIEQQARFIPNKL